MKPGGAAAAAAAHGGQGLQFPFRSAFRGATRTARVAVHRGTSHSGALTCRELPPRCRLSRARPPGRQPLQPQPQPPPLAPRGASVTLRFGSCTERRCSKRCGSGYRLFAACCVRPVWASGVSSAARSDCLVQLAILLELTPSSKTGGHSG